MIETVGITDSRSLIDIRGGSFDEMLLVANSPIVLTWGDCEGSVAQYLIRAGELDHEDKLRRLRHVVEGNLRNDAPISDQIAPLVELLAPGHYQFELCETISDYDFIDFDSSWNCGSRHDHFYPFGVSLVYTLPVDSLNPDRVAHFIDRIEKGARPIAITLTSADGWSDFVVDGHHKLQAYRSVTVAPTIIRISRLDPTPIPVEAIDTDGWKGHPMARHYRSVKSELKEPTPEDRMRQGLIAAKRSFTFWQRAFPEKEYQAPLAEALKLVEDYLHSGTLPAGAKSTAEAAYRAVSNCELPPGDVHRFAGLSVAHIAMAPWFHANGKFEKVARSVNLTISHSEMIRGADSGQSPYLP